MTTINAEPRPGTAYKTIMEERDMLDEFMAMVEKKYVLFINHLHFNSHFIQNGG
jgi:hypothetical protein